MQTSGSCLNNEKLDWSFEARRKNTQSDHQGIPPFTPFQVRLASKVKHRCNHGRNGKFTPEVSPVISTKECHSLFYLNFIPC